MKNVNVEVSAREINARFMKFIEYFVAQCKFGTDYPFVSKVECDIWGVKKIYIYHGKFSTLQKPPDC